MSKPETAGKTPTTASMDWQDEARDAIGDAGHAIHQGHPDIASKCLERAIIALRPAIDTQTTPTDQNQTSDYDGVTEAEWAEYERGNRNPVSKNLMTAESPLKYKGVAPSRGNLDLDRGEFGYVQDEHGNRTYLVFWPWDCTVPLPAAIAPHRNGQGATWTLTGPDDAPTLHPSVDAKGIWHGFLTSGRAKQ